ncbi:MAG: glycine zipper 2TM domain-containing protein [Flavobacterium sp.]|nr:MAG: glycine zipper 2TM domain-containing protein [Flavobacterium sp.]
MKKLILIPIIALFMFSCKNNQNEAVSYKDPKQFAIDSMKNVMDKQLVKLEKQKSIDSMKIAMTSKKAISSKKINYYPMHANPVSEPGVVYAPPAAPAKKKMRPTTKGALIGAGVGAIGGAIIDKKKPWQGALIGGVVGAVAGAGTGAIIEGQQKRKAAQNVAYAY